MPMAVINGLKVLHLLTVMLAAGGAMAQLLILAKSRHAGAAEAEADEKMALAIFRALVFAPLMLAFLLGLGVAGLTGKLTEGWLHAKLTLALIWVALAHMQLRGMKRMVALRAEGDTAALEKTKGMQLNMSKGVTVLILVIVYLAVFQIDAF